MKIVIKSIIFLVLCLCLSFNFVFGQSIVPGETEDDSLLEVAVVEEISSEDIDDSDWFMSDDSGVQHLVPVLVTDTAIPISTKILTNTPIPPTATATATEIPTNTPIPPIATATATKIPTNTPIPSTATATETEIPTNTPIPSTATATATEIPTNTPIPPIAAATATQIPTNTPIPPTATATATQIPTNTPILPTAAATATVILTDTPAHSADIKDESINSEPLVDSADNDIENQKPLTGQSYHINLFTEPQVIKLPRTTTSYKFFIPEGTEIEDAELCLYLETSASLLGDYSAAAIEVNGTAVESLNLVEFVENKGELWKIRLPVDWLKADGTLNEISIVTTQHSNPDECADIDDSTSWLIISENSYLLLTILNEGHAHLDKLYPYLFNRAELGNKISIGFEFAGSDPEAEFSSALSIASAIGRKYTYKDIEHMTVSDGKSSAGSHFVINADSSTNSALPKLTAEEGYLGLSYDNDVIIDVAGGQASGLTNAVRTFSDEELLSQFSVDNAIIRHMPEHHVSSLPSRMDGHYTLEDFNYSDINLAGALHQHTSFTVHHPDGVMGGPGSYFEVHFRHSDALLSESSMLTVQFDGVPASSIQLSRSNTENGTLRTTIPQDVLAKGMFEIGIDVYNYLGKIDCSKDWYDIVWTVIDSDSVVYFEPSGVTVAPSLERFPTIFAEQMVLNIPENSSDLVKESMLMLAARNSQNTLSAPEYTAVQDIDKLEKKDVNMIIAGARSEIKIPVSVMKDLYIVPQSDGYTVKDGVNVMPEALSDKIIVQAVRSPYDHRRVIYVIIWPDDSYEQALLEFASDKQSSYQLSGQLALIGDDGTVSLNAAAETEEVIPFSPDLVVNRVVRQTGIPRIGLGIILVLVIVIIVLIIRAARNKNRIEAAQPKMEETNSDNLDEEEDEEPDSDEQNPAPDDHFDDFDDYDDEE